MRPADLGLPPRFPDFRSYTGFDQLQTALQIATGDRRFEILNAATGCLSGDTKIQIARGSGVRVSNKTIIAQEFRLQFRHQRRGNIQSYTRSLVGGFLRHQRVQSTVFSGVQETYVLILTDRKRLRATPEHKILTENGYCQLTDLTGKDRVIVDAGILSKDERQPKAHYKLVYGLLYHPYAGHARSNSVNPAHRQHKPRGRMYRVAYHRLVVEAHLNGLTVVELVEICRRSKEMSEGLRFLDPAEFAVHHRDNNPKNNCVDNLEVLSHSDHARRHDPIQHLRHQIKSVWVSKIYKHGIEDTYDLVMGEDNPNFVANGIVVHNSGKSLTGATVAALTNARVLVLTATKELQLQYVGDGLVKRSVTGHRNYWCASRAWASDAEPDDPDYRCSVPRARCNWWGDVQAALASRSVITNYAFWLSIGRYGNPDLLGDFDLLVCDEVHEAKSWLSKALTITITPEKLRRCLELSQAPGVPRYAKIEDWGPWASDMLLRALNRRADLALRKGDPQRRKLDRLIEELSTLQLAASRNNEAWLEPWIVTLNSSESFGNGVSFTPRWGADFSEQLLFRGIPRVLLMSATVSRHDARYLGIPDGEWAYHEIPSPFDVRRRPVVWVPTTRVDFRMSDGAKYKLHRRVDEIIEAAIRKNAGNVLIHTGSYERNRELMAATRFAPLIITHNRDSADFKRALEQFKEAGRAGRFAVFASPRAQEGIDLPDDLARIQIIMKVPFPFTLDPLTKARAAEEGYRNLAVAESMMQMCGRAVRGAGDWATTFVLDDHFAYMRRDMPVPEWFRAGFQKRDVEREPEKGFGFLSQALIDGLPPLPPPPENRVTFLLPV